jgi:hypothetical protein
VPYFSWEWGHIFLFLYMYVHMHAWTFVIILKYVFAYLGNETLLACLHNDLYLFHSDSVLQLLQPVNIVILVT